MILFLVSINIFKSFNKNDVLLFKVKLVFAVSFVACFLSLYFSIFGAYYVPNDPVNISKGFGSDLADFLLFFGQISSQKGAAEIAYNALKGFGFVFYFLNLTIFGSLLIYTSIFFENNKEEETVFRFPHFYLSALSITFSSLALILSFFRAGFADDGARLTVLGIMAFVFALLHFTLAIFAFKLGNKHKRLRRAINNISIKSE